MFWVCLGSFRLGSRHFFKWYTEKKWVQSTYGCFLVEVKISSTFFLVMDSSVQAYTHTFVYVCH